MEAEAPILWLSDAKSQLIGKDPDDGKDWGQEEKGMTEDEMVGWDHWLNGHDFEQTLGDREGQGCLTCCSPGVAKSQTWLRDWTIQPDESRRFIQPRIAQSLEIYSLRDTLLPCFTQLVLCSSLFARLALGGFSVKNPHSAGILLTIRIRWPLTDECVRKLWPM